MTKHEENQQRCEGLAASAGVQNILVEILDRMDAVERQMTAVYNYSEGTWREVYELKESLRGIGELIIKAGRNT